eukprot:Tamp_15916.p1 GENE.Tamp_15916~~Tamp_15916.p1  ORF type:complete len:221 (-),score=42.03 Tamp_15916:716-1378(-)
MRHSQCGLCFECRLESMMKDAGINGKKAANLKQALTSTGSLPPSLSSASTSSMGSVGKQYSASSTGSVLSFVSNPRNSDRGRRTKSAIEDHIARDPEQARAPPRGGPGINREVEKDRLASLMQYEGNVPQVKPRQALNTKTKFYCPRDSNALADPADPSSLPAMLQKRFAELTKEVEENQRFLHDMTKTGQAKRYTAEINGIIAEKTREMREIDAKLSQL